MKDINNQKWQTGLYIRLSKEDGDKPESNSITNQRKILKDFISSSEQFYLVKEYIDDGYSGTSTDRPAFQQMLMDIRRRHIDCIIVKDLSRFCRDHILAGLLIEREFISLNIRFIAVLDNYDSMKGNNPADDLLFPVKNILNELYSKDLSRKIKKTYTTRQKEGAYMGSFPCYGYLRDPSDKHRLIIDEYAAGIVKKIFNMYLSGTSMRKIAEALNDENILSPAEYKSRNDSSYQISRHLTAPFLWSRCAISETLRNEMYIGNMVQGKTISGVHQRKRRAPRSQYIIVPGTHEAIIDKESFCKVQKLLSANIRCSQTAEQRPEAIFSGFLRCGDCGMALTQYRQKNNIAYRCSRYARYGTNACSSHYISQNHLSQIILSDLKSLLDNIKNIEKLIEDQKNVRSAQIYSQSRPDPAAGAASIISEISKKQNRKLQAYADYQDGLLKKEDYLLFCDNCNKDILLLEQKKEALAMPELQVPENQELPWINRLQQSGRIDRLDQEILYEMIDKITVYQDKTLVIRYRFNEEALS